MSEDLQQRLTKKVCLACNREFTGIVTACPHDGTVLIPLQQDQLVGTKLADRYLIMSVIGHGGMGVVYKAKHELMDRVVAIKMLQSQLISDSLSVKRFQQEARAASKLKHPNVITLFDFGVSPSGQPYLVMDYLQGVSLADVIKKDGQVGVDRCLKVFTQACSALDHAHKQGVLHRDLKPGNIMLIEDEDEKDMVKVVDFGVAKLLTPSDEEEAQRLTQTGEVCGSPVYMSPEQCMGQKLDPRSDIYSMGVVIYESLTGRLPLLGKTMVDTMSKHISEMPPPFSQVRPDLYIPERLEAVVFKALQKDKELRHQTMEEFEQELQFAVPRPGKSAVLRGATPVPAPLPEVRTSSSNLTTAPPRSAPPVVALAAAVVVAAIAALAFFLLKQPQPANVPVQPSRPGPATSGPAAKPVTAAPPAAPAPPPATAAVSPPRPAAAVPPPAKSAPAAPTSPRPARRPAARSAATSASSPDSAASSGAQATSRPAAPLPPPPRPAVDRFEQLKNLRSY